MYCSIFFFSFSKFDGKMDPVESVKETTQQRASEVILNVSGLVSRIQQASKEKEVLERSKMAILQTESRLSRLSNHTARIDNNINSYFVNIREMEQLFRGMFSKKSTEDEQVTNDSIQSKSSEEDSGKL
eukprot:m.23990 g.23990  ORF g.23990 m.23990 type:complete len:129 (+) comp5603_c1_seq1:929-1315(+)